MTTDRLTYDISGVREIQDKYALTEAELDRAFQRARRRAGGAGRDRAFRQLQALTGEGRQWWSPNRVFAGADPLSGDGRVWVGLNELRTKSGVTRRFPQLQAFDGREVRDAMVKVFMAELDKAACQIVTR